MPGVGMTGEKEQKMKKTALYVIALMLVLIAGTALAEPIDGLDVVEIDGIEYIDISILSIDLSDQVQANVAKNDSPERIESLK